MSRAGRDFAAGCRTTPPTGAGRRDPRYGGTACRKRSARPAAPSGRRREPTRGGGFVIGQEFAAEGGVKFGGAAKPNLAVPLALRVTRRPEPTIQQRLRTFGQIACFRHDPFASRGIGRGRVSSRGRPPL